MSEPILLLRLEGPSQSWGTRARWDVRDTGLEPTKSGVVGLLGAALGVKRGDKRLEELDRDLRFGVRVDCPGVRSTDYHTVTGYHRTAAGDFKHREGKARSLQKAEKHAEATIVSERDYLEDASFLVALASVSDSPREREEMLGVLADALKSPKWPLFLGRKACVPSCPILKGLPEEYEGLEAALREAPWRPPLNGEPPQNIEAWIECSDGDHERQDALRVNSLRLYEFRRCQRLEVDTRSLRRRR